MDAARGADVDAIDRALEAVADARLTYTTDDQPGYRRRRRGRGFSYEDPAGDTVEPPVRDWIESLAIPPAWSDVWICSRRNGHLLATGRDATDVALSTIFGPAALTGFTVITDEVVATQAA